MKAYIEIPLSEMLTPQELAALTAKAEEERKPVEACVAEAIRRAIRPAAIPSEEPASAA